MRVLVVVVSGVVLLALVAAMASSCDASTHEMRILGLGATLVAGLVRLAFAGTASTPGVDTGSGPDSVRRGPPDPRPQLAGSTCSHCEQKIMLETEAVLCKTCQKPLHRECRKDHKQAAHAPRPAQAYR
jgi:hypothetical protein